MPFIYQQLQAQSNLRKPIVVVEGLEIKPYLLADAVYASWNYLLCHFKLVDENLDKIILTNKRMLIELKVKMILRFSKIGGRSCITSMHILMELPKLWWFVVSFVTITN